MMGPPVKNTFCNLFEMKAPQFCLNFLAKHSSFSVKRVWSPGELSTIDLELHGFVTPLFLSPKLHDFVAKSIKPHEKDPFKGRLHEKG